MCYLQFLIPEVYPTQYFDTHIHIFCHGSIPGIIMSGTFEEDFDALGVTAKLSLDSRLA